MNLAILRIYKKAAKASISNGISVLVLSTLTEHYCSYICTELKFLKLCLTFPTKSVKMHTIYKVSKFKWCLPLSRRNTIIMSVFKQLYVVQQLMLSLKRLFKSAVIIFHIHLFIATRMSNQMCNHLLNLGRK